MTFLAAPILHIRSDAARVALIVLVGSLAACGDKPAGAGTDTPPATEAKPQAKTESATLTLGAYTTPREAYGTAILPAFAKHWAERNQGQKVEFKESYLGSGAQARAIVGGFEADVAALSLEPDVQKVQDAGLIKHDWKAGENQGIITRSIVVIGVRKGNPKKIVDWDDLTRPGLEVLTPDVRTSGGAMWNVAAAYGAALRGKTKAKANDPEAALKLLGGILRNVKILDRGARESLLNFERGVGDAIITYENEVLVGRSKGQDYEYVIPKSTILIENPAAVVDGYVERHGNRELARAFLDFMWTPEAQSAFAEYGLRPVVESVAAKVADRFPKVDDLFTSKELGGWPEIQRTLFDKNAGYDRALQLSRDDKL